MGQFQKENYYSKFCCVGLFYQDLIEYILLIEENFDINLKDNVFC